MYENKLDMWTMSRQRLLSRCRRALQDCSFANVRANKLQWRGSGTGFVQQVHVCYWDAQGSTQTNTFHKKENSRIRLKFMPNNKTTPTTENLKERETTTKTPWQRNKLESNIKLKQIPMNSSWLFWRQWNETARNSKISCRIHLKYNARQAWEEKSTRKTRWACLRYTVSCRKDLV